MLKGSSKSEAVALSGAAVSGDRNELNSSVKFSETSDSVVSENAASSETADFAPSMVM